MKLFEVIKINYQLRPFFHYFQKRHSISRPDSQHPQWSRQAVITVSRSTWKTTKIKWSRHRSFLYGCDRSSGMHVFKLRTEIPNLRQHNWSTTKV